MFYPILFKSSTPNTGLQEQRSYELCVLYLCFTFLYLYLSSVTKILRASTKYGTGYLPQKYKVRQRNEDNMLLQTEKGRKDFD